MKDLPLPTLRKGTYRHSKSGKMYDVVGVALQTETDEPMVVYRPLYDSIYELYVRPYNMFVETVELDGDNRSRFEFISE